MKPFAECHRNPVHSIGFAMQLMQSAAY